MNHLGGMVIAWWILVEWLPGPIFQWSTLCISLVDCQPGTKGFEMSNVEKLQVQPLGIMGSAWII